MFTSLKIFYKNNKKEPLMWLFFMERKTRLELATVCLEGRYSTNWATSAYPLRGYCKLYNVNFTLNKTNFQVLFIVVTHLLHHLMVESALMNHQRLKHLQVLCEHIVLCLHLIVKSFYLFHKVLHQFHLF